MNQNEKQKTLCSLFGIRYPIVQAGMVWVSGANLAAASSEAGCLGLIGAGSMTMEILRSQIQKTKLKTAKPFGVNLPLLYHGVDEQIRICLEEGVRIFFTSAGSPKKYTTMLKKEGAIVVHVCASAELAKKCEDAGVDAVVAEGFEAGGHNGRDEETTLVLLPQVVDAVRIPVIAAGGIACGRSMLAVAALGAHGFQLGSRFAATEESSAHPNFKTRITNLKPGDTMLSLKKLVPVRLIKNHFFDQVHKAELGGASAEELGALLGKGRAKMGMFEGDLDEGELEIGQVAARFREILPVKVLVQRLLDEYDAAFKCLQGL